MIKVFVMQTCPDCAAVKKLAQDDTRFQIIDIGEHVRNLKQFLALRDINPAFTPILQSGKIGIPCFLLEDGTITFSLDDAVNSIAVNAQVSYTLENEEGNSCSIDGKGC